MRREVRGEGRRSLGSGGEVGTGCQQDKLLGLLAQVTPRGRTGRLRLVGKGDKQRTPQNIPSRVAEGHAAGVRCVAPSHTGQARLPHGPRSPGHLGEARVLQGLQERRGQKGGAPGPEKPAGTRPVSTAPTRAAAHC